MLRERKDRDNVVWEPWLLSAGWSDFRPFVGTVMAFFDTQACKNRFPNRETCSGIVMHITGSTVVIPCTDLKMQ